MFISLKLVPNTSDCSAEPMITETMATSSGTFRRCVSLGVRPSKLSSFVSSLIRNRKRAVTYSPVGIIGYALDARVLLTDKT